MTKRQLTLIVSTQGELTSQAGLPHALRIVGLNKLSSARLLASILVRCSDRRNCTIRYGGRSIPQ